MAPAAAGSAGVALAAAAWSARRHVAPAAAGSAGVALAAAAGSARRHVAPAAAAAAERGSRRG
ncbi:MAG: hypothetical protein ABSD78_11405 [Acidimicrobiales bacterium]